LPTMREFQPNSWDFGQFPLSAGNTYGSKPSVLKADSDLRLITLAPPVCQPAEKQGYEKGHKADGRPYVVFARKDQKQR
jgi:hypothetical protein